MTLVMYEALFGLVWLFVRSSAVYSPLFYSIFLVSIFPHFCEIFSSTRERTSLGPNKVSSYFITFLALVGLLWVGIS